MGGTGSLGAGLADLIWPARCVSCNAPGRTLCPTCVEALEPVAVELRLATGAPLNVTAAGAFQDGLRAAIVTFKERCRGDLARELAALLAIATERAANAADDTYALALVPVPSTRAAARARGGQHVLRLARIVAASLRLPVARDALALVRATQDSAGLGIAERQANLSGAMVAAPPPRASRPIAAIVVDDVITTGATLGEAVRALQLAGWPVAAAATIAATPRRFPRPAHPEL